jgi:hypothetical protein
MFTCFARVLHPQLLSHRSADVTTLPAEVTRACEAVADVEATCDVAALAAEVFACEATAAQDNATLRVKDAEDWTALAEREALERVSRAEAKNATTLASAHENVKSLAQKVALLEDKLDVKHRAREMSEGEHRVRFEELTLLQTRGSELCHPSLILL